MKLPTESFSTLYLTKPEDWVSFYNKHIGYDHYILITNDIELDLLYNSEKIKCDDDLALTSWSLLDNEFNRLKEINQLRNSISLNLTFRFLLDSNNHFIIRHNHIVFKTDTVDSFIIKKPYIGVFIENTSEIGFLSFDLLRKKLLYDRPLFCYSRKYFNEYDSYEKMYSSFHNIYNRSFTYKLERMVRRSVHNEILNTNEPISEYIYLDP